MTAPILFDRPMLRKRRARAAATLSAHDAVLREACLRMADSLEFLTHRFPTIIELGSHGGQLAELISERPGTQLYIQCDISPTMLKKSAGHRVALDEEWLPFADNSADAIFSVGSLHWVNDLPGTLAQVHRILKPDGLFMAVLPGAQTLQELRDVAAQTDAALLGGITPRVSPFIDIRDAGALLQRAGFALPVADSEMLTVTYSDLFMLSIEIKNTAQANLLQGRLNRFTPRTWFMEAAARYARTYCDAEGRIPATLELVTLTGWKPSSNQQQPARRGSGKMNLGEVLS